MWRRFISPRELSLTVTWLHVLVCSVCVCVAVACRYIVRATHSADRNANSHVIGVDFCVAPIASKRLSARAQLVCALRELANISDFRNLCLTYASGISGCNLVIS